MGPGTVWDGRILLPYLFSNLEISIPVENTTSWVLLFKLRNLHDRKKNSGKEEEDTMEGAFVLKAGIPELKLASLLPCPG
jgi:hypothetical protein